MAKFNEKYYKSILKRDYTISHNNDTFTGTIEEIIDYFKIPTVPSIVASRIISRVRDGSISLQDAFFLPQTKYKYYHGQMRTVREVSEETGIPVVTLNKRMFNKGVDLETAVELEKLKRPKNKNIKKYIYKNYEGTAKEIINKYNPEMDSNVFTARMRQGWDVERALYTPITRLCQIREDGYQKVLKDELLSRIYSYKGYEGSIEDIIKHFRLECSLNGVCRRLGMNWPVDSAFECSD